MTVVGSLSDELPELLLLELDPPSESDDDEEEDDELRL